MTIETHEIVIPIVDGIDTDGLMQDVIEYCSCVTGGKCSMEAALIVGNELSVFLYEDANVGQWETWLTEATEGVRTGPPVTITYVEDDEQ